MRTRLGVRRTASSRFEPPLRVTVSCMAQMMAAQLADLELFGRRRRRVRHVRGELPLEVRPVVVMMDACRRVIRSRALNHPPPTTGSFTVEPRTETSSRASTARRCARTRGSSASSASSTSRHVAAALLHHGYTTVARNQLSHPASSAPSASRRALLPLLPSSFSSCSPR